LARERRASAQDLVAVLRLREEVALDRGPRRELRIEMAQLARDDARARARGRR
jgi:hypothetical protein